MSRIADPFLPNFSTLLLHPSTRRTFLGLPNHRTPGMIPLVSQVSGRKKMCSGESARTTELCFLAAWVLTPKRQQNCVSLSESH